MSESKYNDAYKKGIAKGKELKIQECVFACDKDFDEYDKGYQQGRADAIEDIRKIIKDHDEGNDQWDGMDADYTLGLIRNCLDNHDN